MPFIFVSFVGIATGVVYQRWRGQGFFVVGGLGVIGGGVASALLSWRDGWAPIGRWFVDQPSVAMLGAWPLAITAGLAVWGFTAIRRASV